MAKEVLPTFCEYEGLTKADSELLLRLDQLCPEIITLQGAWTPVPADIEYIEDDGGWLQADLVPCEHFDEPAKEDAAAIAQKVTRELRWYFQERDSRLLRRWQNPVSHPDARRVFARRLQRYMAALARGDLQHLNAWCKVLRRVVELRLFTCGNWLWPSRFEPTLEACMVLLEGLRFRLGLAKAEESEASFSTAVSLDLDTVAAHSAPSRVEVEEAMRRREQSGIFSFHAKPLERFVLYRQLSRANNIICELETCCPTMVPGLRSLVRLHGIAASTALAVACLDVSTQITLQARAYAAGEADALEVSQHVLKSWGSILAIGFFGRYELGLAAGAMLLAGDSWLALGMNAMLGRGYASLLAGSLTRVIAAGSRWGLLIPGVGGSGSRTVRMRVLRSSYAALGLSPQGTDAYGLPDIQAQLAWLLQNGGGRPTADSIRLFAAYQYIRLNQHPGLRDPWRLQSTRSPTKALPALPMVLPDKMSEPSPEPSADEVQEASLEVLPHVLSKSGAEDSDGAHAVCSEEGCEDRGRDSTTCSAPVR
eukprot:gnl/TRDRNA2_/TRDRNA2_142551_c0_seq1.p1 gnl/TRDRNA2_/TRDRNA2_142551_c0~~gnl/TRDRNA2_/TRDRNA2_142551_c0_seq1.p1  ORF type:complete len:538 (-),score=71.33 gnl/TRDRNA2_/TRDRNA2_142551_c0_seq1:70-1683(-)